MEKVKTKNVISHINDIFFESVEEQGCQFQLRRTNLQRDDGRTLNIVDEIEVEELTSRLEQIEEEKKDQNFEDFKEMFFEHLEGIAQNEREAHESHDEAEEAAEALAKAALKSERKSVIGSKRGS